jgi:hypothetical protein
MRKVILCLILLLPPSTSYAKAWVPQDETPGEQCHRAIEISERASRIPYHLLKAIGLVESGRLDTRSRTWKPWPWTVDVNGQGHFYESKEAAIAAVRQMQASGARSIDVGCMQVNLQNHPNAFATLDDAFDPMTNARYAGKFLRGLFGQTNDWAVAAAYYHSQTPERAQSYAIRVAAFLPATAALQAGFAHVGKRRGPDPQEQLAAAWAAANGSDSSFTFRALPGRKLSGRDGHMFGTVRDVLAVRLPQHGRRQHGVHGAHF